MALQRRFGPVNAPGVVIIEKPAERPILPAELGTTAYPGVLERGSVGKLISPSGKKDLIRKTGALVPGFDTPLASRDFYDLGRGAGTLHLVRITDGNEVKGSLVLFDRKDPSRPVVSLLAENGGRWSGKKATVIDETTLLGDIGANVLTLPGTDLAERWTGGRLRLLGLPARSFRVIANTTTTITVDADEDMAAELAAGADTLNQGFVLELDNEGKELGAMVTDGEELPATEWGLSLFVDGEELLSFPNLSSDPASARYFVDVINENDANDLVRVTDLLVGAPVPGARPTSFGGKIVSVAGSTITVKPFESVPSLGNTGDGVVSAIVLKPDTEEDTITLTVTDDSVGGSEVWSATSVLNGTLAAVTTAVLATAPNDFGVDFTISAGGTDFVNGDVITLHVRPLEVNALAGTTLVPDQDERRTSFRIASNTVDTITVSGGVDLSAVTSAAKLYLAVAPKAMNGGVDGNSGLTDLDYQNAYDVETSLFNELKNDNFGLVKFATPGITSASVAQAGREYVENKNWQYRLEVPAATVTEQGAEEYVEDTVGRSDFLVVTWPSFATRQNPETAALQVSSMTGAIHGREALVAREAQGYHKAAAGLEVSLPLVVKLPTGKRLLNLERLTPRGINTIRLVKNQAILWGDRTLFTDPAWRFKHQRELMSHYENTLQEAFEFIIFALNNRDTQDQLLTSFRSFFIPEFTKGAVRGDSFEEAVQLKIDDDNNTNATRANGKLNAEIILRLADTVEQFIITIGKAGIFENVTP